MNMNMMKLSLQPVTFNGLDLKAATDLVDKGSHRWIWKHGVLEVVPADYQPKPFERFLRVPG